MLKSTPKPTGLRYWMERVLDECDKVSADFSADPVHDLRVALRRCRSMADGMMAMDPDKDWKAMKKAGKKLFQRLGDLRDVQIMMEWIEKLEMAVATDCAPGSEDRAELSATSSDAGRSARATPGRSARATPGGSTRATVPVDPADALVEILRRRESEHKQEACVALEEFDRKQWREWSKSLPRRATRIRPGSTVFKHLALERWTAARELHTTAMRNRSQVALHTLRIGIKRFRYIVENFLPAEHKAWNNDLKHMQDLLGEVHDLDVLWATAISCNVFPDEASRQSWHARIMEERTKRIDEYRQNTTGQDSLWIRWRSALPQSKQIQAIATRRMKLWAKALDPDFSHSERVARMSLDLYDGLVATGLLGWNASPETSNGDEANPRASLYAAALLHDVGKAKGNKGHHKESLELIKKHGVPLGWKEGEMQRAAIVARFHTGALPVRGHKALRDLLPDEQKTVIRLSAILRLANALDVAHDGHVRKVKIENGIAESRNQKQRSNGFLRKPAALGRNEALVIGAEGYGEGTLTAQTVTAERYLLETVLRRPVVVRTATTPGLRRSNSAVRKETRQ